ncbi:MAG: family 10 glycosylhydrolase [Candidatus Marinimicrobia bacterium]|jgi:uncharacterized lipoprotein YddW (UPF0748 family)|nr:family 10 glycosylhydrolase [Candidatus Neomarinimicrobiota bacterium]MDP6592631.1 family 10 glycosylhydrolase [Candidatus Neomarinimicrobiota bacterium]MDP6836477.1 family 10 glycosylhydrolase [Candidatus Neomarinimicrobiota bacterium]MDP6967123.1 family 10 glycosylhydrolase [Candidatus Neomarinimicrobiota bacterium]|tara:strand:- start:1825 stop:3006 length:1182 start_codon:yes stop_codon:yes gene_type:complete
MRDVSKATLKVAFFCFTGLQFLQTQPLSKLDFRGIWVVRSSLTSQEDVDRALRFAKAHQFNNVFVQMRGRGDAFYNSHVVKKSQLVKDPQFDPLEYAVLRGHDLGLKIHAWLNVYLIWSSDHLPEDEQHVYNQFPEWIDKTSLGKSTSAANSSNGNGNTLRFLSPAHPGVTNHLVKVIREVLTEYEIDGIHLDYIRYGDSDFGYNIAARIEFERRSGVDPLKLFTSSGYGMDPVWNEETRKLMQEWDQFRREMVTDFVKRCSVIILNMNPGCLLTAAVKPNPKQARDRYFQEWDKWLTEGLVDYVVPMNYASDIRGFASVIDDIYEVVPNKYWPGIIMGISVFNQSSLDSRDKIHYSRVTGFQGISLFSYDSRKDDLNYYLPIVEEMVNVKEE